MTRVSSLLLCAVCFALSDIAQECGSPNGTWRLVPAMSFFAGIEDLADYLHAFAREETIDDTAGSA